jgi:hypothetical protein
MRTIILLLLLTIGASAQCLTTPKGTGGYATFDVSPIMSQIYGRAGNTGTGNDVNFILQGYSGVAWLSAPVIDLNYSQLNLNKKTVTFGPPDSGGIGFRALVVPN